MHSHLEEFIPRNIGGVISHCINLPCFVSLPSTVHTECPNRSKMYLQLSQLVMQFRLSLLLFLLWEILKGYQSYQGSFLVERYLQCQPQRRLYLYVYVCVWGRLLVVYYMGIPTESVFLCILYTLTEKSFFAYIHSLAFVEYHNFTLVTLLCE